MFQMFQTSELSIDHVSNLQLEFATFATTIRTMQWLENNLELVERSSQTLNVELLNL